MKETLECRYAKTIYKDEKTGYTRFTVQPCDTDKADPKYGVILCEGHLIPMTPNTPLTLTGDYSKITRTGRAFVVSDYSFGNTIIEDTKRYIASGPFPGVGPATAEKIINIFGQNVFGLTGSEEECKQLTDSGIKEELARAFLDAMSAIVLKYNIFQYLRPYGCSVSAATNIASTYGKEAPKKIKTEPYDLVEQGMSYSSCDRLAMNLGRDPLSKDRIRALAKEAHKIAALSGNTVLDIRRIKEYMRNDESSLDPLLYFCEMSGNERYVEVSTGRFMTEYAYENTAHIVDCIKRLNGAMSENVSSECIEQAINNAGIELSPTQQTAVRLARTNGVKIITGGPGTGKTTTLSTIISAYDKAQKNIILCAPTGRAAKRMSGLAGKTAQTIHSLLGLRPGGRGNLVPAFDKFNHLPADLLVIDEASMLDEVLASLLFDAIPTGCTVVISGDEDQLPSIGAGAVLHDMIASDRIQTVRLQTVYRQAGESGIVKNAVLVREGNPSLVKSNEFMIVKTNNPAKMIEYAKSAYSKFDTDPFDPFSVQLFCPVRSIRYEINTTVLNEELRGHPTTPAFRFGRTDYYVGDKIVMTRNNYKTGYLNGDFGVIRAFRGEAGYTVIVLEMDSGDNLEITGDDVQDMELAYSSTIHKAQGSECDTAIIVLPRQPEVLLHRSVFYTGITRAKKRVIIISENDALETAIRNNKECKRDTFLAELLKKRL